MPKLRLCMCLALFAGLIACIEHSAPSAGTVFAGPSDLPLHEDVKPKSKIVVRVQHGDRLAIVQQRRRLYKLRTAKGIEGWTDERNLMSVEQMDALANLEKQALSVASQGVATSFETLNVHTEPQRFSPSFFQIREGEKFEVIAHQTASRAEPTHRVLVKPQPRSASGKKRPDRSKRIPPPPAPAAPKPPDDWVELSEERTPPPPPPKPEPIVPAHGKKRHKEAVPEVAPMDDWTLVRTFKGAAGWVLTNRIYLAIPDEVAQYAEGHRITTYFSLGKIHDGELNVDKDIWLWTTVHAGQHPYDFDSFRVFTWNPKKHRYETAYIQRTVEGYLPVTVKKDGGQETFSLCLADEQGARVRKRFVMLDRQVRGAGEEPCANEPLIDLNPKAKPPGQTAEPPHEPQTLTERLKGRAAQVQKKLTGK